MTAPRVGVFDQLVAAALDRSPEARSRVIESIEKSDDITPAGKRIFLEALGRKSERPTTPTPRRPGAR